MSKTIHLNDQSINGHNIAETLVHVAATCDIDLIETDTPTVEGDYAISGNLTVVVVPDSFDTDFLQNREDCNFHISI